MARVRHLPVALVIGCCGVAHNVLWRRASAEDQAYVYQATGAALLMAMTLLVLNAYRSPAVLITSCLALGYAVQVVWCNVAFVLAPWPLIPGEALCTAGVGGYLTIAGLVGALWVMLWLLEALARVRQ